jgi:hypothetical protein
MTIWRLRSRRATEAHYRAALLFRVLDRLLTVLNVCSSIAVMALSSAYWIIEAKYNGLNILISIAGIVTMISSVLQYILDHRIRSKHHEDAAISFSKLNRQFEELSCLEQPNEDVITAMRKEYDELTGWAPPIPWGVWRSSRKLSVEIVGLEEDLLSISTNRAISAS